MCSRFETTQKNALDMNVIELILFSILLILCCLAGYRPPTLPTSTVAMPSSNGYGTTSIAHTPSDSHDDSAIGTSDTASTHSFGRHRANTVAAPATKPKPPVSRRHSSCKSMTTKNLLTCSLFDFYSLCMTEVS